jgi:biopolymer transport protein ExbD
VEGRLSVLQKYGPILRTGLIMPDSSVAYEDIVRLMDEMKKYGIRDMGLSPL